MFSRSKSGRLDGGEGRGIPLGGQDTPPSNGYKKVEDDDLEVVDRDTTEDLFWDDGDPADRRKDPLRK